MLTDTHCHLDSEAFDTDRPAVIQRALDAGLGRILVPGVDVESSRRALELADKNPVIFAAVGVHPTDPSGLDGAALQQLRTLAANPKVVAIGEIGLDYYWVKEADAQSRQRSMLEAQLSFAQELHKPVILHARERGDAQAGPCGQDLLEILEAWVRPLRAFDPDLAAKPGVLHSFSGSMEVASRALELGFLIGVTGPVTYKNAAVRRDLIGALPLERLLIETDAPYLAPDPHRGRRNEPAFVTHIADKIAEILSRTPQEVAAVTGINAARLFNWGEPD